MHRALSALFLAATALAQSGQDGFVCPAEDIANTGCMGPKDCLYAYSGNCDKFIYCDVNADGVSARPTVKDCPAGLEWNDNQKVCDWPANSTCDDAQSKSADTAKEPLPPPNASVDASFSCLKAISSKGCQGRPEAGGACIFANPNAPNSYIQCPEIQAFVVQCKSGEVYNDNIKACE